MNQGCFLKLTFAKLVGYIAKSPLCYTYWISNRVLRNAGFKQWQMQSLSYFHVVLSIEDRCYIVSIQVFGEMTIYGPIPDWYHHDNTKVDQWLIFVWPLIVTTSINFFIFVETPKLYFFYLMPLSNVIMWNVIRMSVMYDNGGCVGVLTYWLKAISWTCFKLIFHWKT